MADQLGEKDRVLHDHNIVKPDITELAGDIDPIAEKKLLRKLDLHVVPPLFLLFLFAFLDRTNIGNAKIQGLTTDLKLHGQQYNIALFVFFIPYILFEVPSNIIIKRVAPSTWLASIMFLWGVATMAQGFVQGLGGLVACRFLVGLFEAGLFPGCAYLISMYYKRYELQWRLTLFFCASIIAGAFAGLLAYGIAHMDGVRGYHGWRWIFILEGLLTAVVGIISKFLIVDWPETATFLNESERAMLVARLARDTGDANMNRLDRAAGKRIVKDWKIWCGVIMYIGVVNTGYSTSFFLPTIINQLGYKAEAAQVRTIPIFIVATALALTTAVLTDRLKHRYSFTMIGVLVATVGYVILLNQHHVTTGVKYFACFMITVGGYITQPVTIAWLSNTMGGHYKRSVSVALQVGLGNVGGIIASNVFLTREVPLFKTGYSVGLALMWMCGLACTIFYFGLKRENQKRERGERDYRLQEVDADNLGDDHPHFRFVT